MPANIHDSLGFLTFFFFPPQKSFTDTSSAHKSHVTDSSASFYPCTLPAASCSATQSPITSRLISLDFTTYPSSHVGGCYENSISLLGNDKQHSNQLINLILFMTSVIIEPPYFLTLILKNYHHGYATANSTSVNLNLPGSTTCSDQEKNKRSHFSAKSLEGAFHAVFSENGRRTYYVIQPKKLARANKPFTYLK